MGMAGVGVLGMSELTPNWVRLALNGTNLGLLKISFSTDTVQYPRFVPFRDNLTKYGTNSYIKSMSLFCEIHQGKGSS